MTAAAAMDKARALGERLHRPDLVSYALNADGLTLVRPRPGRNRHPGAGAADRAGLRPPGSSRPRVLQPAGGHCPPEPVRGLRALLHRGDGLLRGPRARRVRLCLLGWRACALLLTGRWDEAAEVCVQMLGQQGISPVNQINPLRVLGSIRGRRGEAGAWDLLDEALALANRSGEPQWIAPVRAARAELRWVAGQPGLAAEEVIGRLRPGARAHRSVDVRVTGHLAAEAAGGRRSPRQPSEASRPSGAIRPGDGR